ncbi:MAG: hypothetical protein Q4B04_04115 [bacterium]|nr:hypothetical protein [bacterium]
MGFFKHNFRPGPGVEKNQPQKREFFYFFELLFLNMSKIFKTGFIAALFSAFLVTNGLGEVGLTFITRAAAKRRPIFEFSDFFDAVKKHWKTALPLGILNLVITIVSLTSLYSAMQMFGTVMGIILILSSSLFVILFMMSKYYHYFLLITYDMPLFKIYTTSLKLAFCGLLRNTLISFFLLIIYGVIFVIWYYLGAKAVLPLTLLYFVVFKGLRSLIIQFNIFPIVQRFLFDPYYNEHPDEDIELRKSLGIYVESAIEENEDETVSDEVD